MKMRSSPPSHQLASLLKEWQQGGTNAELSFQALAQAVSRLVHSTVAKSSSSPDLSPEITQTLLIRLSQKAEQLAEHPQLDAWVRHAARLEVKKHFRTESRKRRTLDRWRNFFQASQPSIDPINDLETGEQLNIAISNLSSSDQDLLKARYQKGFSYQKIAQQSGQSPGALRMRHHRLLATLRQRLKASPFAFIFGVPRLSSDPKPNLTKSFVMTTSQKCLLAVTSIFLLTGAGVVLNKGLKPKEIAKHPSDPVVSEHRRIAPIARNRDEVTLDYPVATKLLEEIYQRYPNLRATPPPAPLPGTATLHESLAAFFELYPKEDLELPREIRKMLDPAVPFDAQVLRNFFKDKGPILEHLKAICHYQPSPPEKLYRLDTEIPEFATVTLATDFLNMARVLAVIDGQSKKAEYLGKEHALLNWRLTKGRPAIATLLAADLDKTSKKIDLKLWKEGYEPAFIPLAPTIFAGFFSETLRVETVGLISLFDHLDQTGISDNPAAEILSKLIADNKEIEVAEVDLSKVDWRDAAFEVGARTSETISRLDQYSRNGDLSHLITTHTPVSESAFSSEFLSVPLEPQIAQQHRLHAVAAIADAFAAARRNGENPTTINDLVPLSLPFVPIDPETNQPMTLETPWSILHNP